ncbi:MAG TPA: calcium/proton exchanger [Bacteroidia bacterium]|nr:calcium/proton exchanger [Bacteroidia bacterium]
MKLRLKPSVNWLLLFVPIAFLLSWTEAPILWVFFVAAISIIPVSVLIGKSTEQLTAYTSDAVGGLLTATFGNLPELIIGMIALKAGLYEMLLATMAGAIIANLLLVLGLSFLVCGIKFHSTEYNSGSVRVYSSMMLVATISLMVPSAFNKFEGNEGFSAEERNLNIGLAIALLLGYILYLVFMLKTHPHFFKTKLEDTESNHTPHWSLRKSLIMLLFSSTLVAFLSEILVGAAEETGHLLNMSSVFIGIIFIAIVGAAGNIPAVVVASKGKMDLSIGIIMGSAIQIALFVAPLLSLCSLFLGPQQLALEFSRLLIMTIFLSVLLGTVIAGDGIGNWYKGVQLLIMYLIIGMMFFLAPH